MDLSPYLRYILLMLVHKFNIHHPLCLTQPTSSSWEILSSSDFIAILILGSKSKSLILLLWSHSQLCSSKTIQDRCKFNGHVQHTVSKICYRNSVSIIMIKKNLDSGGSSEFECLISLLWMRGKRYEQVLKHWFLSLRVSYFQAISEQYMCETCSMCQRLRRFRQRTPWFRCILRYQEYKIRLYIENSWQCDILKTVT